MILNINSTIFIIKKAKKEIFIINIYINNFFLILNNFKILI